MIGPGGVGKSSFLRGLMNQRLVQDATSTIFADTKVLKQQFWAKGGESADSYWTEVTDQDEIQELAEVLQLVVLAKKASFESISHCYNPQNDCGSCCRKVLPTGIQTTKH